MWLEGWSQDVHLLIQQTIQLSRKTDMNFPTLNKHNSFVYVTNTRLSCSFNRLLAITVIPVSSYNSL